MKQGYVLRMSCHISKTLKLAAYLLLVFMSSTRTHSTPPPVWLTVDSLQLQYSR